MSVMSDAEYRENEFFRIFGSVPFPAFEDTSEQLDGWGHNWGCTSDVGKLRAVLMHRPGDELKIVDPKKAMPEIGGFGDPDSGWYWIGKTPPDLALMQKQHDALVKALKAEGVDVILTDRAARGRMKQIYTRDSCIGVPGGAIITRMARRVRRGEERPVLEALAKVGCPVLRTLHGGAIFEGGGFAIINRKTAVCSVSIACNREGVRQIEDVLKTVGMDLIKVEVPGYRIHIDGMFMMVDVDTAIVNPNELPYTFIETLREMKIRTIDLPPDDSPFSLNCLAVSPGRVLMHPTITPRLADRLDKAGITVVPVDYGAVELGGGGIHCSTAPLIRDPV